MRDHGVHLNLLVVVEIAEVIVYAVNLHAKLDETDRVGILVGQAHRALDERRRNINRSNVRVVELADNLICRFESTAAHENDLVKAVSRT